jgi:hypothetical protein
MKKIVFLLIVLTLALGTLFYFSDISFQMDKLYWKPWLKSIAFFAFSNTVIYFVLRGQAKRHHDL